MFPAVPKFSLCGWADPGAFSGPRRGRGFSSWCSPSSRCRAPPAVLQELGTVRTCGGNGCVEEGAVASAGVQSFSGSSVAGGPWCGGCGSGPGSCPQHSGAGLSGLRAAECNDSEQPKSTSLAGIPHAGRRLHTPTVGRGVQGCTGESALKS